MGYGKKHSYVPNCSLSSKKFRDNFDGAPVTSTYKLDGEANETYEYSQIFWIFFFVKSM